MNHAQTKDHGLIISPIGHFDLSSEPEVVLTLLDKLNDDLRVTIDFAKVTFIDSIGIGVLLQLKKMLPRGAPRIRLSNISDHVFNVLRICNLQKVFDIYNDVKIINGVRKIK